MGCLCRGKATNCTATHGLRDGRARNRLRGRTSVEELRLCPTNCQPALALFDISVPRNQAPTP